MEFVALKLSFLAKMLWDPGESWTFEIVAVALETLPVDMNGSELPIGDKVVNDSPTTGTTRRTGALAKFVPDESEEASVDTLKPLL